jgi:hypothetical protein
MVNKKMTISLDATVNDTAVNTNENNSDSNNDTAEDSIAAEMEFEFEETQTTMMLRNIPPTVSKFELVTALESAGYGSWTYDFLHFPFSLSTKQNVGYAFINFRSNHVANKFADAWNGSREFRSHAFHSGPKKTVSLVVTVAAIQGQLANLRHLMQRKAGRRTSCIQNPKFQPVIYDEAGKQVSLKTIKQFIEKLAVA